MVMNTLWFRCGRVGIYRKGSPCKVPDGPMNPGSVSAHEFASRNLFRAKLHFTIFLFRLLKHIFICVPVFIVRIISAAENVTG